MEIAMSLITLPIKDQSNVVTVIDKILFCGRVNPVSIDR